MNTPWPFFTSEIYKGLLEISKKETMTIETWAKDAAGGPEEESMVCRHR